MWCSNDRCQRPWAAEEALPLEPVIERRPDGDRAWHPCPACLEKYRPAAELAHALRARTARELSAFDRSGREVPAGSGPASPGQHRTASRQVPFMSTW